MTEVDLSDLVPEQVNRDSKQVSLVLQGVFFQCFSVAVLPLLSHRNAHLLRGPARAACDHLRRARLGPGSQNPDHRSLGAAVPRVAVSQDVLADLDPDHPWYGIVTYSTLALGS